MLPFFEAEQLPMLHILTDRGSEYCGRAKTHDYQLYLAINDIEHIKTKGIPRRPTASVNTSTRRAYRSFMRPCKKIWTTGSIITIISEGKTVNGRE
jgi:hypothetical protein